MVNTVQKAAGLVGIAGIAALAWGIGFERRWYRVRHEHLPVLNRHLPDGTTLRLLHFGDLHYLPGQTHRLRFVAEMAERYQPDLIVSTGDNLESNDGIGDVVALHRQLLETTDAQGVAILGAHDRWGPKPLMPWKYLFGPSEGPKGAPLDTHDLVAGFEDAGWHVPVNAATSLTTSAGRIDIVAVDDPHANLNLNHVIDTYPPANGAILGLGLVHAPYTDTLAAFDKNGFDLVLSGHTHGGQINLPGVGALANNTDLPLKYSRGSFGFGEQLTVHITAGLGHSIYAPIRFGCRPELNILTLTPKTEQPHRD